MAPRHCKAARRTYNASCEPIFNLSLTFADVRVLERFGTCSLLLLFLTALFEGASEAAINTELVPSLPSPAPLGTTVTWTAKAMDTDVGNLWYRFSVRPA